MYPKTKSIRIERRAHAYKIQESRNKLSDKEQLARLDKILGKNKGAERERARLKERNLGVMVSQDTPKSKRRERRG